LKSASLCDFPVASTAVNAGAAWPTVAAAAWADDTPSAVLETAIKDEKVRRFNIIKTPELV
jgi:hypothetical protein